MAEQDKQRGGMDAAPARVRMGDVATLAGVSPATVSRVFGSPELVSPSVRGAVLAAADKLGFRPNRLAGSFRNSKANIVGVIVPSLTTSFFAQTLQSLTRALETMQYSVMVCSHDYDLDREEKLLETLLEWSPSAVVTTGTAHTKQSMRLMLDAACPIVEMWDIGDNPIDSVVGFSNRDVGVAVAHHMWKSERRKLAFVGRSLDRDQRGAARCAGFVETIVQLGGTRPHVIALPDQSTAAGGVEAFGTLMDQHPDIDGIAFSNDILAIGGIFEAMRRGISIPGDVSIVGYGDLDFASSVHPSLTTVRPPHDRIGTEVAQLLARRFAGDDSSPRKVDLGFEFIARMSG
ncbi:MAG TPA: LacI family DNA-binding transcriptional regulator [Devosia sp.]|nr:LacI family DNA-binding transcriptional regulator [Devosia sp.]